MEHFTLSNGINIPVLGSGTFQITDSEVCRKSVLSAFREGYRMIDTAACYGNEKAIGDAVSVSGIAREDIFLVSKVWVQDSGFDKTLFSFEKTLRNLGTDYLDLYLIHMPLGDYMGSWRAMERIMREGMVKAIGVCNFSASRLVDLVLTTGIIPMVNQVEMHPFCQQRKLRRTMDEYGIRTMAWAPFAEGRNDIFSNPVIRRIAEAHGKTSAEVILRFLINEGAVVIPKSVHEERIRENADIDFALTEEELETLRSLDEGRPMILDIEDPAEPARLHGIRFIQ